MKTDIDIEWYIDEGFGNPFEFAPSFKTKLIINAAITGIVPTREKTPHVPLSPKRIVADAIKCCKAGASIVHLHAKDENGNSTYKASVYKKIISGIREENKNIIICASTSGRVFNSFENRSQVLLLEGDLKPDMASLTLGSLNFPDQASVNSPKIILKLASMMFEKGIKPELEIFETGMINYAIYLKKKRFLKGAPFYFNLILGSLGTMPARVSDLGHLIKTLPDGCLWAGSGVGRFQLPINILSIIKGGHVRTGLEDNIYFDNERNILATNEQLVKRIVSFSRKIGRDIATPEEARAMLGLNCSIIHS